MGGVICMSNVIDISPANLDSRLCLLQPVFLIFYIEYNIQMTKYSLDVLIFLFGTSLLFHIQFSLFLPDLHKGCSRDMSGHLIIPCLSEVSILFCDSQIKSFGIVNKTEKKMYFFYFTFFFLELFWFFNDLLDVVNLISSYSAFSKAKLDIWKFNVHILLKSGLENFENYLLACEKRTIVVWALFGIAFLWG